jgi:hypothetical protein
MINQLFREIPDRKYIINILNIFGLNDFNDSHKFTKNDLLSINTLDNLIIEKDTLIKYYIDCKGKIYLNNITLNRAITILRQLLKLYGYNLNSTEQYINGNKIILYNVSQFKNNKKIIIKFE